MDKLPACDICGRSENELQNQNTGGSLQVERDKDGLWICGDCNASIISEPIETAAGDNLDDKLMELVGKSAGEICHTLNLPYTQPYKSVIDAASKIAYDEDRYLSAWSFLTQWDDGTTVWQSADKSKKGLVYPDGRVEIQERI